MNQYTAINIKSAYLLFKSIKRMVCLTLFLVISCTHLSAGEIANTLVVKLCSGETMSFLLSTKPKITFSGAQLVVKSDVCQIAYDLEQVDHYSFSHTTTDGIDTPLSAQEAVSRNGDCLTFSGMKAGSLIEVFSAAGETLSIVKADTEGRAVLSISGMPQGVYIVKYGKVSAKILKL